MRFIDIINWKKFFKIITFISIFIFLIEISIKKFDWYIFSIPFLFGLMMLIKSHSEFLLFKDKYKPDIKELRMLKLKKVNRKSLFNKLKI